MKSNWRNLEKNTGDIFWGVLLLIAALGMLIAGIVLAAEDDATLLLIFIPLAVAFFVGSVLCFKDAGKAKEYASQQKAVEEKNYEEVKKIGEIITSENLEDQSITNSVDKENYLLSRIPFSENLWALCEMIGKPTRVFVDKAEELFKAIYVRNDMMHMSEKQICVTIIIRLKEAGVVEKVAEEKAKYVLLLYKMYKTDFNVDCSSDEWKTIADSGLENNETFNIESFLLKGKDFSYLNNKSVPFENLVEFLLFVRNNPSVSIVWSKEDSAITKYKTAFNLYEAGLIIGAVNNLLSALKINPIFVSARFELANAYIVLRRFDLSKSILLDMTDYIFEKKDCALFYRRLGYMYIENNNPDLAYSCYRFSQRYESNPMAEQELNFIKEHFEIKISDFDISLLLKNNNIPLLNIGDIEQLKDDIKQLGIDEQ